MAINCSSNALLDTLNAKKDLLNSKVAELQSAGAGAMEDLKAKADAMKDSLLAAVPVPPAIPNFKKELDALKGKVGKELADAKAAFKERWGDALPDIDIDGMIANATSLIPSPNFDFCKDVPNVEAPKVSADGVVEEVKVKAEVPIVAADIPKKVEPVVPTVVEKEKQASSSGLMEKSLYELLEDLAPYEKEIAALTAQQMPAIRAYGKNEIAMSKNRNYKKLIAKKAKTDYTWPEYYNTVATDSEKKLIEEKWQFWNEGKVASINKNMITQIYTFYRSNMEVQLNEVKNGNWKFYYKKTDFSGGVYTTQPADVNGLKWLPIIEEIHSRYLEPVRAYNNYKRN